jgi:hypothetical protein
MPDFSEYADDAKKFASEHSEQSDNAFDQAAEFADEKTGNRFDRQIQQGERAGENYLGVQDQDQQDQQGQGGGQNQGDQYGDQGGQGGDQGDQNQGGQY